MCSASSHAGWEISRLLHNHQQYQPLFQGHQAVANQVQLGTGHNMQEFLADFLSQAKNVNWQVTLTDPVGNFCYDLLRQYGSVTLQEVRTHAATYGGTQSRHAQNVWQIYLCLNESLMLEAKNKVVLEAANYSVNTYLDSLLYFKVIVQLSYIITRANVTVMDPGSSVVPQHGDC
jgi:hypothetical protein